ncbi:MAG: hypothetical protein JWN00_5459 [Actinomycetia bacterium]|nr:hypothetical protein [Actinomycetes bacterium]
MITRSSRHVRSCLTAAILMTGPVPAPATMSGAPSPTLVTHTVLETAGAHSGGTLKGQIWIAATGATARNATITISASPKASVITASCTLTVDGKCKLGDLDTAGVTVPITVATPSRTTTLTLILTVTAAADNATTAIVTTRASLPPVPTPSPSPSPRATTPSPNPGPSITPTVTPTTSLTPSASTSPVPTVELPLVAAATTGPTGGPTLPPARSSGAQLHAASSSLSIGTGVWLLLLLVAAVIAAVVPARKRRSATARALSARRPAGQREIDTAGTMTQRSPRLDLAVLLRFRIFNRGPGRSTPPRLEASVIKIDAEPDEDPPIT